MIITEAGFYWARKLGRKGWRVHEVALFQTEHGLEPVVFDWLLGKLSPADMEFATGVPLPPPHAEVAT